VHGDIHVIISFSQLFVVCTHLQMYMFLINFVEILKYFFLSQCSIIVLIKLLQYEIFTPFTYILSPFGKSD
jgi:hypothetical protein